MFAAAVSIGSVSIGDLQEYINRSWWLFIFLCRKQCSMAEGYARDQFKHAPTAIEKEIELFLGVFKATQSSYLENHSRSVAQNEPMDIRQRMNNDESDDNWFECSLRSLYEQSKEKPKLSKKSRKYDRSLCQKQSNYSPSQRPALQLKRESSDPQTDDVTVYGRRLQHMNVSSASNEASTSPTSPSSDYVSSTSSFTSLEDDVDVQAAGGLQTSVFRSFRSSYRSLFGSFGSLLTASG